MDLTSLFPAAAVRVCRLQRAQQGDIFNGKAAADGAPATGKSED